MEIRDPRVSRRFRVPCISHALSFRLGVVSLLLLLLIHESRPLRAQSPPKAAAVLTVDPHPLSLAKDADGETARAHVYGPEVALLSSVTRTLEGGAAIESPSITESLSRLDAFRKTSDVQDLVPRWADMCAARIRIVSQEPHELCASSHAAYVRRDFEAAVKGYTNLLAKVPGHLPARNNLALTQIQLGKDLLAHVHLELLTRIDRTYAAGWINLAVVCERLGRRGYAKRLASRCGVAFKEAPAAAHNAQVFAPAGEMSADLLAQPLATVFVAYPLVESPGITMRPSVVPSPRSSASPTPSPDKPAPDTKTPSAWGGVLVILVMCAVAHRYVLWSTGASRYDAAVQAYEDQSKEVVERYRSRMDVDQVLALSPEVRDELFAQLGRVVDQEMQSTKERVNTLRPLNGLGYLAAFAMIPPALASTVRELFEPKSPSPLLPTVCLGLMSCMFIKSRGRSNGHSLHFLGTFLATVALGRGLTAGSIDLGTPVVMGLPVTLAALSAWLVLGALALLHTRTGQAVGIVIARGMDVRLDDIEEPKPREKPRPQPPPMDLRTVGFRCGKCNRELPGKLPRCPHCGVQFGGVRNELLNPPKAEPSSYPTPRTVATATATGRTAAARVLLCVLLPAIALMVLTTLSTVPPPVPRVVMAVALACLALVQGARWSAEELLRKGRCSESGGGLVVTRVVGKYEA